MVSVTKVFVIDSSLPVRAAIVFSIGGHRSRRKQWLHSFRYLPKKKLKRLHCSRYLALKKIETVLSFSLRALKKIETDQSFFLLQSLENATVTRSRYGIELKT
jgi:hypothetical protein